MFQVGQDQELEATDDPARGEPGELELPTQEEEERDDDDSTSGLVIDEDASVQNWSVHEIPREQLKCLQRMKKNKQETIV